MILLWLIRAKIAASMAKSPNGAESPSALPPYRATCLGMANPAGQVYHRKPTCEALVAGQHLAGQYGRGAFTDLKAKELKSQLERAARGLKVSIPRIEAVVSCPPRTSSVTSVSSSACASTAGTG
jgi:hypothetical protein